MSNIANQNIVIEGSKKYYFGTRTIYWEMGAYLSGNTPSSIYPYLYLGADFSTYYNASIENKIDMVNESLKKFLISKISRAEGLYIQDLKDKILMELMEILENNAQDEEEVWAIVHYLLGTIGDISGFIFTMWGNYDDSLIGQPRLDYDKQQIEFHMSTTPLEIYKFVTEKIFNTKYLKPIEDKKYSLGSK